jgi:hypothetical protein
MKKLLVSGKTGFYQNHHGGAVFHPRKGLSKPYSAKNDVY